MKYYISKPKSHKADDSIINGIKTVDPDAAIVKTLYDADVCVLQKGWTKSKICVADYHLAGEKRIKRVEGYVYTDKFAARLN